MLLTEKHNISSDKMHASIHSLDSLSTITSTSSSSCCTTIETEFYHQNMALGIMTFTDQYQSILQYIQENGFHIVQTVKQLEFTKEQAESFFNNQSNFDKQMNWLSSTTVCAFLLEKENVMKEWKQLMGPSNYKKAKKTSKESIRAKYGKDMFIYGSDIKREIEFIFNVKENTDTPGLLDKVNDTNETIVKSEVGPEEDIIINETILDAVTAASDTLVLCDTVLTSSDSNSTIIAKEETVIESLEIKKEDKVIESLEINKEEKVIDSLEIKKEQDKKTKRSSILYNAKRRSLITTTTTTNINKRSSRIISNTEEKPIKVEQEKLKKAEQEKSKKRLSSSSIISRLTAPTVASANKQIDTTTIQSRKSKFLIKK